MRSSLDMKSSSEGGVPELDGQESRILSTSSRVAQDRDNSLNMKERAQWRVELRHQIMRQLAVLPEKCQQEDQRARQPVVAGVEDNPTTTPAPVITADWRNDMTSISQTLRRRNPHHHSQQSSGLAPISALQHTVVMLTVMHDPAGQRWLGKCAQHLANLRRCCGCFVESKWKHHHLPVGVM